MPVAATGYIPENKIPFKVPLLPAAPEQRHVRVLLEGEVARLPTLPVPARAVHCIDFHLSVQGARLPDDLCPPLS